MPDIAIVLLIGPDRDYGIFNGLSLSAIAGLIYVPIEQVRARQFEVGALLHATSCSISRSIGS